ncbi:hypothetical protein FD755_012341 [Muntiacus reevesi]|uniref:Src kinase-associated phosphoprotein 2 n=1 Tax=Muntiacus reevesi TaxID=9886 RepID=A0A5N3XPX6_MUNRE|nr:hypothetical protein FD755_012341 [Muntiacus reevesi]
MPNPLPKVLLIIIWTIKKAEYRRTDASKLWYQTSQSKGNQGTSLWNTYEIKLIDLDLINLRNQFPPIAAQDLPFVLKAGYLEKRRKDHSFLGFEWQKRWCALSKTVFYYYGSDKDKQQKGEFAIDGYNVRMNNTLRKDGKKDCCFEISAPDKRIYQFTAASPKDAEEWVQQLKFVLQGDKSTDYANFYQGLWDCTGALSDELSFKRGDVIYILSKEYNRYGWWVGEMKGAIGLVPKAYIMEMYDI